MAYSKTELSQKEWIALQKDYLRFREIFFRTLEVLCTASNKDMEQIVLYGNTRDEPVSIFQSGNLNPDLFTIFQISKALDIPPAMLFSIYTPKGWLPNME